MHSELKNRWKTETKNTSKRYERLVTELRQNCQVSTHTRAHHRDTHTPQDLATQNQELLTTVNALSAEQAANHNRVEDSSNTLTQYRSVAQRSEHKMNEMRDELISLQDREKQLLNDNKILVHRLDEVSYL